MAVRRCVPILLASGVITVGCGLAHGSVDSGDRTVRDSGTTLLPDAGLDSGSREMDAGVDACEPSDEICNGVDDDCDGLADEATGLPACELAHASAACIDGACRPSACDPGWGDCDAAPGNGCETNVDVDAAHCGRCGRGCEAGVGCADGLCADERIVQITTRLDHSCALRASGEALCWGGNDAGQLGTGDTVHRLAPAVVAGTDDYVALTAGMFFTCALRRGGGVACWGDNSTRSLGDGTTTSSVVPVDVVGLHGAVVALSALSGPNGAAYAITDDARLWGWGNNYYGQVGDPPDTLSTGTDPRVFGPSAVADVTGAYHFVCAIDLDGEVTCLGAAPTVDFTGIGAVEVDGGRSHACILDDAGSVHCMGDNTDGQVGPATCTECTTPVMVSLPEPAVAVEAGGDMSCAILVSGALMCWGDTQVGRAPHATPSAEVGLPPIDAFALGPLRRCALDRRARVWCWGSWSVGDGTTEIRRRPVEIRGIYD